MSERPPCDLPGCEKPVEEFEPGQYRRYCTSAHRKVARKLRRDSEPLEEVEPTSKFEPEPSPPADPVPAAVVAATNQQFDPDATTPIPRIPAGKSPPANPGRKPHGTVVAAPEPGLFRRRGLRPFASRGVRQGRGRPAPPLDPAQPDWLQPADASTLPQEAEQHPQWVPEPQWVPVPQWTPTQWAPPPAQAPPPHSASAPPAAPPQTGPPSTRPASTGWPQFDSAAPPVAPNPPAPASPPTPPVNDPQSEAAQAEAAEAEAARAEAARAKAEAAKAKAEAERAEATRVKAEAAKARAARAEAAKAKADRAKAEADKAEADRAEAAEAQAARDQAAKTQPASKPGKAKQSRSAQLDPSEVTAPIPRVVIPQQTPPVGQPPAPSWQSYANYPPMPSPPDEPAIGRRAQRAERRADKHRRKAEQAVLDEQAAAVLSGAPIPGLPESPAAARRRRRREAQLAKPISLNPPAPAMWLGHMREALISALQSLANNRLRSLLTTIGIIAGVASVIMMVAMGDGMQKGLNDSFSQYSTLVTFASLRGEGQVVTGRPPLSLTDKDYQALHDTNNVPDVVEYTSTVDSDSVTLAVGQQKIAGVLEGVEHNFLDLDLEHRHMVAGRWFTQGQITSGVRQAIITANVVKDLWGPGTDPHETLGKTVRVGHNNFQVQGVLSDGGSSDDEVLAPLTSARSFVVGNNGNLLTKIIARARDTASLNDAEAEICTTLDAQHHIPTVSQRDYYFTDSTAQLEQQESFTKFLRAVHRGDRQYLAVRRRGRNRQHHVGLGHRTDQGNRHPQGHRGAEAGHHAPVPQRGGDAHRARRPGRGGVRYRSVSSWQELHPEAPAARPRLAHPHPAADPEHRPGPHRVRDQPAGRPARRRLPGIPGLPPAPDRSSEVRVMARHHHKPRRSSFKGAQERRARMTRLVIVTMGVLVTIRPGSQLATPLGGPPSAPPPPVQRPVSVPVDTSTAVPHRGLDHGPHRGFGSVGPQSPASSVTR